MGPTEIDGPDCASEECCDDLRAFWATSAEGVFDASLGIDRASLDRYGVPGSFPDDVDFTERAVLVAFVNTCLNGGWELQPRRLHRAPTGGVQGVFGFRRHGDRAASTRPVVFVETPADWVGPIDLEYRFP